MVVNLEGESLSDLVDKDDKWAWDKEGLLKKNQWPVETGY